MLQKLKTLIGQFRMPRVEEREMHYLNGSVDRYDLEYRQRQVDLGVFRRRYDII